MDRENYNINTVCSYKHTVAPKCLLTYLENHTYCTNKNLNNYIQIKTKLLKNNNLPLNLSTNIIL